MARASSKPDAEITPLDPDKSLRHLLEECRMVLPGIQALFGFQLVAVFDAAFWKILSDGERVAHLVAVVLMAMAMGFALAPAAYHRLVEPNAVSRTFLTRATHVITTAMGFLMSGSVIDLYLIARTIVLNVWIAGALAAVVAVALLTLWLFWPLWCARQRWRKDRRKQ